MVFDVPAEGGGALSVLNDFYNQAKEFNGNGIKWVFVVSTPKLEETKNIKVIRIPWIKKSWGHRLFFDYIIAPLLVRKHNIQRVFSLQNLLVPRITIPQILYVHNSLPFIEHKFSLRESPLLWVYQNIIGKRIINSIKNADKVIVQTKWMLEACKEKTKNGLKKIEAIPPEIKVEVKEYFQVNSFTFSTFFYPASGVIFKNHRVIVDACQLLVNKGIKNFKVIFTLNGSENDYISKLKEEIKKKKLPIDFVGNLTREKVFNLYSKSILLFPSYVESSPLPLTEAKLHHSIIIASNYPFSREILMDYENAIFFEAFNSLELCEIMLNAIAGKIDYKNRTRVEKIELSHEQKLIDLVINN